MDTVNELTQRSKAGVADRGRRVRGSLLLAVQAGLASDRARRVSERDLAALRERFEALSPREREIMIQVTQGRLGKQIANDVGLAEGTVKVHRSRLMRKMKANSLPELSRMADKLKLAPEGE